MSVYSEGMMVLKSAEAEVYKHDPNISPGSD